MRVARLLARSQGGLVRTAIGMFAPVIGLFVACGWKCWFDELGWDLYGVVCARLIAVIATALLAIFALPHLGVWLDRWCFRQGLLKPSHFRCVVSDTGIQTLEGERTTFHPWEGHTDFTEGNDMIFLWRRGNSALPLPKEFAANEAEWERLREALYARLPLRRT